MILCGWCGKATPDVPKCTACGHADPPRPWAQRGEAAPVVVAPEGRPALTDAELRRRLAAMGPSATDETIAEHFDVDPRTVRRWRQKVSG